MGKTFLSLIAVIFIFTSGTVHAVESNLRFDSQCSENPNFIYNTKTLPENERMDKYLSISSYSTAVEKTNRNRSENDVFSVSVSWDNETLSVSNPSANNVTIEFFGGDGKPAQNVIFNKEENPLLLFMDMKMMKVTHTNYLCKMQRDAVFELNGNKLKIKNINFVMASARSKGHLWFFSNLQATVNGETDVIKRLDIVPDVKN